MILLLSSICRALLHGADESTDRQTNRQTDRQTYNMRPVLYKVSLTSIAPFRVNLHVISLCAAVADESPNHSQFQTERKIQIRVEWKENYKFLLLDLKSSNLFM